MHPESGEAVNDDLSSVAHDLQVSVDGNVRVHPKAVAVFWVSDTDVSGETFSKSLSSHRTKRRGHVLAYPFPMKLKVRERWDARESVAPGGERVVCCRQRDLVLGQRCLCCCVGEHQGRWYKRDRSLGHCGR